LLSPSNPALQGDPALLLDEFNTPAETWFKSESTSQRPPALANSSGVAGTFQEVDTDRGGKVPKIKAILATIVFVPGLALQGCFLVHGVLMTRLVEVVQATGVMEENEKTERFRRTKGHRGESDMKYRSEQRTSCLTIGNTETFSISMMRSTILRVGNDMKSTYAI
jgi:hypothetical protein